MMDQTTSEMVISLLRQLIRAVDLQSKKLTKQYGLTGPQIHILNTLNTEGKQPVGNVARQSSLSHATVTSILDRLEAKGMVVRERSDRDKRKVNVSLTPEALCILEKKPPLLQEQFIKRFDSIEEWEKAMILSSLQRLAGMMDADKIESPPILVSGPIAATDDEVDNFLDD